MVVKEPARTGRQRRGGLGVSGGTSASGVAAAEPVLVGCEADLRCEVDRLLHLLAPAVEWTQRTEALLRLERLALGDAPSFAAFPELLLGLRDALAAQMQERRSAVSRQACRTVAALATASGPGFEPLAVHLLPVVFKALAMGIQVVTEAAEACAHAMLAACPSPRLLPPLCGMLCGDRNGRLRQSAAEFLLVALEGWPHAELDRQAEAIDRAVLAAAQDAQAETRTVGRSLFGAYARAWPAAAQAALARLGRDRQLADRLAAAAIEYVPGGGGHSCPASRRSSLGHGGSGTPPGGPARTSSCAAGPLRAAPPLPRLALSSAGSGNDDGGRCSPVRPSSARSAAAAGPGAAPAHAAWGAHSRENQPDNRAAGVLATPRSVFPKLMARRGAPGPAEAEAEAELGRQAASGRERLAPRRSLGGAALRRSMAAFQRQHDWGDAEEEGSHGYAAAAAAAAGQRALRPQRGALRVPPPPLAPSQACEEQLEAAGPASHPPTARRLATAEQQAEPCPGEEPECASLFGGVGDGPAASPTAASLAHLLAGLGRAGAGWSHRLEVYQAVGATLAQSGSPAVAADVASNIDRLVAALLEGAGDAHFRVAAAALGALGAGLASPCTRAFEPQLDRLMTALFARVADPKERIRCLVADALATALQQHSSEAVVGALGRSLHANRAPRVKCAVMEFFAAAARGSPGRPGLLHSLGGSALGGMLRCMLQLAIDKNPDIRRAAAEGVAAAYHGGAAAAVLTAVQALPPADLLAVQRAVSPAIQQQQARGGEAAREGRPPAGAASQAASSAGSRRQSGDGSRQHPSSRQLQRQASSSSLTAGSRHASQAGSPAPVDQQGGATAPAPAPHAAAPQQLTPAPPSPFPWQVQPPSPPAAANAASQAAAAGPSAAAETDSSPARPDAPHHASSAHGASSASQPAPSEPPAPFDDAVAVQLERLLAQAEGGPSCQALQGLSRLAHALPPPAWAPCFDRVVAVLSAALDSGSPPLRDAGLALARDAAAAAPPSLFLPALPALLPRLLRCAGDQEAREVAVAADEALQGLLRRAPPQSCLAVLSQFLPPPGEPPSADRQRGAELHAAIRSLHRVVAGMQPAGLAAHLQPLLVPGLCAAYASPLTDVRKATVDCLVGIWQVVGDAIRPHLEPLSPSQLRLLEIYMDRAPSNSGSHPPATRD